MLSLEKKRVLSSSDPMLLRFIHLATVLSDMENEVCSNIPSPPKPALKSSLKLSSNMQGEEAGICLSYFPIPSTYHLYRVILSLEATNYCGNAEHRQMQVIGRVKYIAGDPCCFPSLPVCVYKFSSLYLNNIMFYRQ